MDLTERRKLARRIFAAAVESVRPHKLIARSVVLKDAKLQVNDTEHSLRSGQKIHIFGSGKASKEMAASLLEIIKDRVAGGVVVTNQQPDENLSPLKIIQGSHPIPDEKSIYGAESLIEGLSQLSENDFFIYLLSGGSSALIEKPLPPITLAEVQETTRLLLNNSVPIQLVNVVRKHLSMVKGGRLAQATRASGVVLVISDVIGDDLSVIGSGPLYYDPTSFADCRKILEQSAIWDKIPASVQQIIDKGENGIIAETPKQENRAISHYLLGSNRTALRHALACVREAGLDGHILSSSLAGEAREVAKVITSIARNISAYNEPFQPPVCLLFGGETTVSVRGSGRGGRNQELALAALAEIGEQNNILLLSGGTDGIDGNSDAAGAVADSGFFRKGAELGLSIDAFLAGNNSNEFFQAVGALLNTGPTGTNVMDITLMIIDTEDS